LSQSEINSTYCNAQTYKLYCWKCDKPYK
jgi:hypothetical protein